MCRRWSARPCATWCGRGNGWAKFLLRQGLHAPRGTRRWSKRYLEWIAQLQLEQVAQRLALADYLAEVEHAGARVARLDEALGQALAQATEPTNGWWQGCKRCAGWRN